MSDKLIEYKCRNCGHSVSTKLRVEGGAKCKECGSISMYPMLESIGAFEDSTKHKDMSYELAYVFLVTIEEQMIKDVADDRCIDAIQTAQKLLKEKITGYSQ
jgi:DNA-directed RNA polymerase subunit RPC12/RpoP